MKAWQHAFSHTPLVWILVLIIMRLSGKNILPIYKPLPFPYYFPWECYDWWKLYLVIISLRWHIIFNVILGSQCFVLQVFGKYTECSGHVINVSLQGTWNKSLSRVTPAWHWNLFLWRKTKAVCWKSFFCGFNFPTSLSLPQGPGFTLQLAVWSSSTLIDEQQLLFRMH